MMVSVDRRSLLAGGSALVGATLARRTSAASAATGVVDLRVDWRNDPLGIESPVPRLSWRLKSDRPGARQVAYRIRVASEPGTLASGRGDLWDSGRVASEATFDIRYAGRALRSRDRCHWSVEAWDETGGVSRPDVPGVWEMGLLGPEDWTAGWLAAEEETLAGDRRAGLHWISSKTPTSPVPLGFRLRLDLPRPPRAAELLVIAQDELDGVWLNGAPVPFPRSKPSVVNIARMQRVALSIGGGGNTLAVGATYRPRKDWDRGGGRMAAVLRISHADGTIERITTGGDWRVGPAIGNWVQTEPPKWERAVAAPNPPLFAPWAAGPAMQLRRTFRLDAGVVRARLYVTALGGYLMRLNGQQVGDALLTPESTDFTKRALYRVFDVTALMRAGDNVLGAHVGDGWYGSFGLFAGRFGFGDAPNRLLAQLEILDAVGKRSVIATGEGWTAAPGPVVTSEIYDGEVYDARREQPGWDLPGFDDRGWQPVASAPSPAIMLTAQVSPPIRVRRTIAPVRVTEPRPGVHVLDFGQNFAGWCRLEGRAPAGTAVTLRFAELLNVNGSIDQSNLRSALARDTYVFSGQGRERYRPHFTYHGFRYVEVTGWPGALPPGLVTAEVLSSDLPETGIMRLADPLLAKLWLNTLWSQRSNFVGLPSDCPQRDERLGWMGDAQVFWDAASFNMDTAAFTHRFMGDVRDAQSADGRFADVNPQPPKIDWRGAPGWADAGILLPWTVWWRYGDTAIIEENWRAMTAFIERTRTRNPDLIWLHDRGNDFGDWLALDAKEPGDPTTPKDLVATAYFAHSTAKLAEMAAASGRETEARRYRELREAIGRAFRAAFVRADGGVGNDSQTGYILALRFELLPPALRDAAASRLAADIRRRGGVLSTGFLGTPHALDVLTDSGHGGLVRVLMARTAFPSWGYMVAKGATTIWERWNGDTGDTAMNSFNHYALGAVIGFFYRRIAGIDAAAPGFRQVRIAPALHIGQERGGGTYNSVVGRITTDWKLRANLLDLTCRLPANVTGFIELPAVRGPMLLNGKKVNGRAGSAVSVPVAAGEHHISLTL